MSRPVMFVIGSPVLLVRRVLHKEDLALAVLLLKLLQLLLEGLRSVRVGPGPFRTVLN